MDQILLINFCLIGVVALILHSYFTRGPALTLNFFLFSFMLTFTKGGEHSFKFMNLAETGSRDMFQAAISTLMWTISFYLSWCMAEKVIQRVGRFKNRVFPLLIFAGIFVASFAYAINTTAINIGGWDASITNGNEFLIIPFYVVKRQFYFSLYFLAAYFLIACSEYKKKDWKIIFFILPFIHTWIPQFFGPGAQFIEEIIVLFTLVMLVFLSPLRYCPDAFKQSIPDSVRKAVDLLPAVIMAAIFFILFFIDALKIQETRLLVSLLPMTILILLAVKRIPLLWVTFIALLCLVALKKLAIPAIVPVGLLVLLQLISKPYLIKKNSLSQ